MANEGVAMSCKDLEQALPFYLYDELPADERAAYEKHLESCPACRQTLEDSRRLHEVLAHRPRIEPTPELVVHCRQALDEALEGAPTQPATPLQFSPRRFRRIGDADAGPVRVWPRLDAASALERPARRG